MARRLGCEAYYHDVPDKGEVFQRVVSADSRVVVTINALGLGIDMPDIQAVIHMDGLRKLRDFAQESSQAGYNKGFSKLIMVTRGDKFSEGENKIQDEEEQDYIKRYQAGTIYSQVVLN